jgi:hypothetical protein
VTSANPGSGAGDKAPDDDDLVPVSVRLGQVVPPEDPEDWTRPLTWAAAAGMLAAPAVAVGWFATAAPTDSTTPVAATWLLALSLAIGAALAGSTQQGALRSATGTVAAGLFAALATVIVGFISAGERQVSSFSPPLAHAFVAALAGLTGAIAAAPLAARLSGAGARVPRILAPAAVAAGVSLLGVPLLFGL